jgi:membrane protease YdiL (CAAX protease family)
MTPNVLDHLLFGLLVLVLPAWDVVALRRIAARIRAGEVALRMRLYRTILVEEWVGAAIVLLLWFVPGRDAGALGLLPRSGSWVWAGYGLTVLVCAGLAVQMWWATRTPDARASARAALVEVSFLIPNTSVERRVFPWVALTAGICEELVYRGFLIAYLAALPGVSWVAAAVLSSVVFGLGHAYQGPKGILRTAAVGLLLAGLYGLTGSLWASIVVHGVMDWTSGRLGFLAFADADHGTPPEVQPA